jgi:hypothetical protein
MILIDTSVDMHLLASALISASPLWSADQVLAASVERLGIAHRQARPN